MFISLSSLSSLLSLLSLLSLSSLSSLLSLSSLSSLLSSLSSLLLGIIGVSFLLLSWKYEVGLSYIIFHGAWHVFSALSASEAISTANSF